MKSHRPQRYGAQRCAAFFFVVLLTSVAALARAGALAPDGNAFYVPPDPLPSGGPGTVIWSRPAAGAGALPSAASNALVLYETTSATGTTVAVSGTVAVPKGTPPSAGWPVVSWSHGTTGNAPQCTPSRQTEANEEQTYLDAWVARGYAVVQTDYEGQGTPGIHPYFVGVAAAHDTIDIVRAARAIDPHIGSNWFAFGHSEGGSAAIFTAALGPAWAPELHLLGAVAFAPASHITGLIGGIQRSDETTSSLPFTLQMIEGIATADPSIHLQDLMTPAAYARLEQLQRHCLGELINDYAFTDLKLSEVFQKNADLGPLTHDFDLNEDDHAHVRVPLLLLQGLKDELVLPGMTGALAHELCANGSPLLTIGVANANHDTVMPASLARTETWVDAVANGDPPASNCDRY